ncbi:PIN domain-containing protein [Pseudomonas sp. ICMP 561]|uniref:PIN domain-containing protein n=1 Tax=Pseudomonas sp. ICMP 561 TaxID=1718918 RepID=UPI000C07513C|nr:PIN domain-containing protein [Pseudomonas sp. ICMP 561]PHN17214.1 hypothetical protein AO242_21215 [Pseudomonas sp. ICMP 561]
MSTLHVFIDTNIFLNFYSFPDDRLEVLDELIALTQPGQITLHLPKQVENEFKRNRESKLQAAMSEFNNAKLPSKVPNHMRGTATARQYDDAVKTVQQAKALLIANATSLALRNELDVDSKLADLFRNAARYAEDDELYEKAIVRMNKGNPPGKGVSVGDRYNWETLLRHVPDGDLFIVSKDDDFVSPLTMDKVSRPLAFLSDEWADLKGGGNLSMFRNIKDLVTYYKNQLEQPDAAAPPEVVEVEYVPPTTANHIDPAGALAVPIPKASRTENESEAVVPEERLIQEAAKVPRQEVLAAIQDLVESSSFADTHSAVSKLAPYMPYLMAEDAVELFRAAVTNSQIGWIISDDDVGDFYLSLLNEWPLAMDSELAEALIDLLGLSSEPTQEEPFEEYPQL